MISASSSGSFAKLEHFLRATSKLDVRSAVESQAQAGVDALSAATPQNSGLAAQSWSYQIKQTSGGWIISWHNSDVESGFPVAIMLQYGYSTGTGGYVAGRDYINPALQPIFDRIQENIWKAVTSA